MIVISFLAIWGAIYGHGPFSGPEPHRNVLSLQLFLMFAAIPFMVLAALAEERERNQEVLHESEERFLIHGMPPRMSLSALERATKFWALTRQHLLPAIKQSREYIQMTGKDS